MPTAAKPRSAAANSSTATCFPDGELPHIGLALESLQRGGLEAVDVESLRRHYARTLDIWAENFETNADEAKQLVDDEKFRIWRVYLAGCAYAFENDDVSIYQIVCRKAGRSANDAAVVASLHVREGALNAADVEQGDLFGVPTAVAAAALAPRKPRGVNNKAECSAPLTCFALAREIAAACEAAVKTMKTMKTAPGGAAPSFEAISPSSDARTSS